MPSRKFRSEGPVLYDRYQFGYCEWLEAVMPADLEEAYAEGFLPHSANPEDPRHLFYMARSLRIALDRLALDKKRRYDHRQWEGFGLVRTCYPIEAFLEKYGQLVPDLAQKWMSARFGDAYLNSSRFLYILEKPFLKEVLAWTHENELVAFALVVRGNWGAHYWYAFYLNGNETQTAPGHGYLIDFLHWAQEQQLPYAYLGTSYGTKSRYKSRGIDGVEFWDGNRWSPDRKHLARLREQDDFASRPIKS